MKRVLFVCSTLNTGGAQKMLSNILINLPEDWSADIVLNTTDNICYPYKGNIISLGITEPINKQNPFYQFRVLLARIKKLNALKNTKEYCACISILDSSNIANIITKSRYCKTIITSVVQTSEARKIGVYRFLVFPLIRMFYNHSDRMIVQTKDAYDDLNANFGIRKNLLRVIPTGVDTEIVKEITSREMEKSLKSLFNKDRTVISAGRLTYQKGHWHLIRAFSEVRKRVPDANLVIFGEGDLKDRLEKMIDLLDIADSVTILPFDSMLDLYIANSAIFAFSSQYEGMPVALLEALSCSVACIATDFRSGAREVLGLDEDTIVKKVTEAKYGIITPLCRNEIDTDSKELEHEECFLSEGIIRLLTDTKYRDKYSGLAKERSKYYDIKSIMGMWVEEIEK